MGSGLKPAVFGVQARVGPSRTAGIAGRTGGIRNDGPPAVARNRPSRPCSRSQGPSRCVLSFFQALRYVVLLQAIRLAIPPLTNRTISITKSTALGSVVAVEEILNQATSQQAILANPSPLMLGAIFFLIIFAPLVRLTRWIERRYGWKR